LSDDFLIDVLAGVGQFGHCPIQYLQERIFPDVVQFIHLLVSHDAGLGDVVDEVLGGFSVLFGIDPGGLGLRVAVFLALILVVVLLGERFWGEDVGGGEDLIEVLELLAGFLAVRVGDGLGVDLIDVGEPVDNEGAHQDGVGDLIAVDADGGERGEDLQLGNLDEAVDVVVGEDQLLQFPEPLQLPKVAGAHDVVEPHVLEADLLHRLLEVGIVEDLEGVAVDEEHGVAFDLRVAGLDEGLVPGLLPALVPVEAELLDPFHLVLPLLVDHLQEPFRRDVVSIGVGALRADLVLVGGDVGADVGVGPISFLGEADGLLLRPDHPIAVPHLRRHLPHVQVLQIGAGRQAELKVALVMENRIPIEGELCQLLGILQALDVVEFFDPVVREEDPLKPRTVRKPVHALDQVPPDVQLSQRHQPIQVLYAGDKVVGKIQHSQLRQMVDILDLSDLVGVKVQHVQLVQVLQVPYPLNVVLPKHQHSQRRDRMQVRDLLDLVVIQVQEDEIRERNQVLYLSDVVVLQVQQSESFLTFQQRHMRELSFV